MNFADLIETKKRGGRHGREEIAFLVDGITDDSIPDYQLAAWLMAVWQRGMDAEETFLLTEAMRDSGDRLDLGGIDGPTADKHSTGGVGDKISLPLAPLAATLGLKVPMLSGRGLGHTGGTLDKLTAIDGYRVDLSGEEMLAVVQEVGCSIIGQTQRIAPADRRLYALRDVTATVDCVPLIVSSILSKKFAAGPEHLVIDLKCGSGAFMQDLDGARELGRSLMEVARRAGKKMSVLVTDMDQPLGEAIGHSLEVEESLRVLEGGGPPRVRELTLALATEMAVLAGLGSAEELRQRAEERLDGGEAREVFQRMVRAHGGRLPEDRPHSGMEVAPEAEPVVAPRSGHYAGVDTRQVGLAVVDLGGGRLRHTDTIDLSVGLRSRVRVGDRLEEGQPLFDVHCADSERVGAARRRLERAIRIGDDPVEARPLVLEKLRD